MQDISGFGLVVTIRASISFPLGLVLTQFPGDQDPLDMAAVAIAAGEMGLNGDFITWSQATPLPMVLTLIPGSEDDVNMQILADNNRVGKGKVSTYDVIDATVVYPDGSTTVLTTGKLMTGQFGKGVAANSKQKTKTYAFAFESKA